MGVHGPSAQNPWIFQRRHRFTFHNRASAMHGLTAAPVDGRASNGLSPVSPGHSQADRLTPSDLKKLEKDRENVKNAICEKDVNKK